RHKLPPGEYIALGGEEPDIKQASFRLMGDALDPDVITRRTGLTPQVAHRKGDPRPMTDYRRREGLAAPPPWRTGIWRLHSEVALARTGHRLDDHIGVLLEQIEPVAATVKGFCAEQNLQADFFCGYHMHQWNSSVGLSAETLTRVAALGAAIFLDVYGPDPDDEERIVVVEDDS
ncbi:MAG: DUF4279 domain-containing protein, partial [Solirubrobacteraceae bacterium]